MRATKHSSLRAKRGNLRLIKAFFLSIIILLCMTSLYAQSTSEETTTITITNARQTTYEKSAKNKDDEDSSEDSQDSIILEGSVEISVAKGSTVSEIKADKVTYDRKTEMLYAEGNVEITTKSSSAGG